MEGRPNRRPEDHKRKPRVAGIDVLRGLCIIAVVIHHINLRFRFDKTDLGRMLWPGANHVLFWSGYYGVRVFFVISGFLITTWSLKRWGKLQELNRRQFYAMRFARIVPCLAALLVLLSTLHFFHLPQFTINPQKTTLLRALFAAIGFHVNWLEAKVGYLPAAWDVLWSLSVEEVFYLGFPLLCTLIRRQWLLVGAFIAFIVAGPFARVLLNDLWSDYGYAASMDGIAFGCLAALLCAPVRLSAVAERVMFWSGVALMLLIEVFRPVAAKIGFYKVGLDVTVLEIGTALLLIVLQQKAAVGGQPSRLSKTFSAPLEWFGRISYEVYLTHMLVVWPMVYAYRASGQGAGWQPLWFAGITLLCGAAGYAVARWYSEPANGAIRARLMAKKSTAAG
ncbi:MAG TPA: acyltransferase [Candidatus Limnocylindrales bacterium]|jgi:peptidoglycan/LPS O-acetylase OafA/YrhL|nr:acyltransferase [Candidatus Limnocylindrales bacterium]